MSSLREPEEDAAVDLGAHLARLPASATCKGMFFRDLVSFAEKHVSAEDLAQRAGIQSRRYIAFFDYPMADNLRLTCEVAKVVHPTLSLGAGVRRLGRTSYATFLSSHAGRVVASTLGRDVKKWLVYAPKAIRMVMNFGDITVEPGTDRSARLLCRNFPAFIETYQVGAIEALFSHFGVEGKIRLALEDVGTASFDLSWDG